MSFNKIQIQNLLGILRADRRKDQTAAQIEEVLHQRYGFPIGGNQQKNKSINKICCKKE